MKRSKRYILASLHGVPYLVPWGQGRAEFGSALEINDVGQQIWDRLEEDASLREIVLHILETNALGPEAYDRVREDVEQFLKALEAHGALEREYEETFLLGGVYIRLKGERRNFPPGLEDFRTEAVPEERSCHRIRLHQYVSISEEPEGERMLLTHEEMNVWESKDQYRIHFRRNHFLKQGTVSRDGSEGSLCYMGGDGEALLAEEVFFGLRLLVLYMAQREGGFALHSASVAYKGRAWLFSGPSGMGKSTHTRLWQKRIGTPVINGDLNMLMEHDGRLYVEGMPWCGTSGLCSRDQYPLGGIIILHRAETDRVEVKPPDKKQLAVYQRLISPFWARELVEEQLAFAGRAADLVPVWHLYCTKEASAVYCVKEHIDGYLTGKEHIDGSLAGKEHIDRYPVDKEYTDRFLGGLDE